MSTCCCTASKILALTSLIIPCLWIFNISLARQYDAGDAAMEMFDAHSNPELPNMWRGVIWMAGNTFPELLVALEAGSYDPSTRTIKHTFGLPKAWSYNTNAEGWLEFVLVQMSWSLRASYLEFRFDEQFTYAVIPFYILGKQVDTYRIKRLDNDGNVFLRESIDGNGDWMPEYTILKVVDFNGTRLPAFRKMVQTCQNRTRIMDIPDIVVMTKGPTPSSKQNFKTERQILVGPVSAFSILLAILLFLVYIACWNYLFGSSYTYWQYKAIQTSSVERDPLL